MQQTIEKRYGPYGLSNHMSNEAKKYATVEIRLDTIECIKKYSTKALECKKIIMIPPYLGCRATKIEIKDVPYLRNRNKTSGMSYLL